MLDSEKYYNNTEKANPHKNIKKFIDINIKTGKAIELGCGAGRDTIFLIKNNWNVLGIDMNDTEERIRNQLTDEENKRFKFQIQQFEKLNLEKADVIVSNFSLPFCQKEKFFEMWNKIEKSIVSRGYFVGNFLGLNDEWTGIKKKMTFLSKEQVESLFENFEIISFNEFEKDALTGMGKMKHWHIFDIIARKR